MMTVTPEFKKENEAAIKKYETEIEETETAYALAQKNKYGEKELAYYTTKIKEAKWKLSSCLKNRVLYISKKEMKEVKKIEPDTLNWDQQ